MLDDCSLKSLVNAYVIDDKEILNNFTCRYNALTSLKGSPSNEIYGVFNCVGNSLKTLKNCPQNAGGIACSHNQLISLKGAPKEIILCFRCSFNFLKNLKYCPEKVGRDVRFANNRLPTLYEISKYVGYTVAVDYNFLTSLDFLPINFGFLNYQ